jgi:hypothetical protein
VSRKLRLHIIQQLQGALTGYSGLDRLISATDWPFNSNNKQHEPTSLPDTRVDLLQEIYDWAYGQDERCIFRLYGLAGTGKSTIARAIACKYYTEGRLGASFFSRGGGDVGHAGKFVTSIAAQLAGTYSRLYHHLAAGFLASVSSNKRENGLVTVMSNQRISWSQDWSELGEEGASQIVDLGLGRFHQISDNSAGRARATLDTGNVSGNWISDDMLKGLEYLFNEDKHQLEKDGSRSAPNNGWRRLTWHEINIWWRSKIESLLGSASLKQLDSIRSTETVVQLLKVFKSLPKVPRGGKRRPGRFSLLALPFILTWATPVAAELSVRENMVSSLRPSILSTYGDQNYEIQKFLLVSMFPSGKHSFADEN